MPAQNIQNTYAQKDDFTLSNSLVETNLLGTAGAFNGTLTFPDGALAIGDHIFLWASGLLSWPTKELGNGTLEIKLNFGVGTVTTGAFSLPKDANTSPWRCHGMIGCRDITQVMAVSFEADATTFQNVQAPDQIPNRFPHIGSDLQALVRNAASSLELTAKFSLLG